MFDWIALAPAWTPNCEVDTWTDLGRATTLHAILHWIYLCHVAEPQCSILTTVAGLAYRTSRQCSESMIVPILGFFQNHAFWKYRFRIHDLESSDSECRCRCEECLPNWRCLSRAEALLPWRRSLDYRVMSDYWHLLRCPKICSAELSVDAMSD